MDRRTYLAAATAALSGCVAGYRGTAGDHGGNTAADDAQEAPIVGQGTPPTLWEEPLNPGGIPPVVDPAFAADWSGVDDPGRYGPLEDGTVVVGLTDGDRTRAYPLPAVWYHEAVNDRFGGPVLVTYCPICRSGMVAERRVAGAVTRFAAAGLLRQPPGEYTFAREADGPTFGASPTDPDAGDRNSGNLVLYDAATGSYWSQLLARAVCGPRTGDELVIVPSTVATWGEWRAEHAGTEVLLPPPRSGTVGDLRG